MGHGKPGKSWNLSISVSRKLKKSHGKVMEFNCWSWKIIVCVEHKLLQVLKQGQNKIQASYVRKYPKRGMILTIFERGS